MGFQRPKCDNIPGREHIGRFSLQYTPAQFGETIRRVRRNLGVTQKELALTSGTGLRFVIDLEKGKETCQLGKALRVLQTLGIRIILTPPSAALSSTSEEE